ncbi:MAG TPA: hypothetical protein VF796_23490 [Humisphaera sp.]
MTTGTTAVIGTTGDLRFEEKPAGWSWLLPASGATLGLGLLYASWPLTTVLSWAGGVTGVLLAAGLGWLTWISFADRARSVRFYRDRVEVRHGSRLDQALRYADVRYVVYGTRGPNTHVLSMMGEDEVPIGVSVMGRPDLRSPGEATAESVLELRDHLWAVVCDHIRKAAATPAGYAWEDGIEIVRNGLRQHGSVIPWPEVELDLNEDANKLTVLRNGQPLNWVYLSARNVVCVYTVCAELKEADKRRPVAAARRPRPPGGPSRPGPR